MTELPATAAIESGSAILFLGAGFSRDATNFAGDPVKDVSALIEFLMEQVGESPEGYDLDSAADEYIRYYGSAGESKISDVLLKNFQVKKCTDDQINIVSQPWYRIYTTNYDNSVEKICSDSGKNLTTCEVYDAVCPPTRGVSQLIHIYGNVNRISPDEFHKTFILTETQRDRSPFLRSAWMHRFYDDVLSASCVIFVGFSLNDMDIRRLLGALPKEVLSKVHFICSLGEKKPILNRMVKYGLPHPIGLSAFAKHLGGKRVGEPTKSQAVAPMYLKEMHFKQQMKAVVSARDIESLLVSGDIDIMKMSQSDIGGESGSYMITRSKGAYSRASGNISSDRPVLIHGDIGNGKTIFAYQIAYLFSMKGFRVFWAGREPENIGDMIAFLQSIDGKVLVIFDDIMNYQKLPEAVISIGRRDILVLATVRTIVLEVSRERIARRLGVGAFLEVDLNVQSIDESKRIVSYFDENGLFGERSGLSYEDKHSYITKKCGGQLRDIIISLFNTGALHRRVEQLFVALQSLEKGARDVIGFGALLSYADFRSMSQFSLVSDLVDYSFGLEDLRDELKRNELSTLIRLDLGDVVFRSPALSYFILSRVFGLESVLSISIRSLKNIDKYYSDDPEIVELGKALLRFSLYGQMVNSAREHELMESFYDDCRTLNFAVNDPLFCVQRSICNLHRKEFAISARFVDAAYAIAARRRNFDTYQIDNHHAELILSRSLEEGVSPDGSRERKAQSLLMSVLARKDDDLYHPLSVMRMYSDIVDKWVYVLSPTQRSVLRDIVGDALGSISVFKQDGRFRNLSSVRKRLEDTAKRLNQLR